MFTVKMLLEIVKKQCMGVFHVHQKDLLLLQTLLDVTQCSLEVHFTSRGAFIMLIWGHNSIILSLFLH